MGQVLVSLVVLAVLGAQAAASLGAVSPLTGRASWWLWPFLDYPMYRRAHYPGETVDRERVVAVFAGGSEVAVTPADLGLDFWHFLYGVVEPVRRGEAGGLAVYAGLFEVRYGRRPVRLRLESRPLVLTAGAYASAPAAVLGEAILPAREASR